jgi:hypothetical protein
MNVVNAEYDMCSGNVYPCSSIAIDVLYTNQISLSRMMILDILKSEVYNILYNI